RGHAHREVAAALQDEEIMVQTDACDVDQVVAEMQGLRARPPLPQPRDDVGLVAIFGERPHHPKADPHNTLPWSLRPRHAPTSGAPIAGGQTVYQPRNDAVTRA